MQGGFQGPWLMATLHKHRAGCVPGLAGLSQPRDLQEGNQVRLTGSSFTKPLVFPKAASLALRDPRLCDKARAETVSYSNGATGKGHRCHQSPLLFFKRKKKKFKSDTGVQILVLPLEGFKHVI